MRSPLAYLSALLSPASGRANPLDHAARLAHMALHDQETGLGNRLSLERAAAAETDVYVVLFGVDRFEVLRNAIGYDAMAGLLTTVGHRFAGLTGASVARVGAGVLGLVLRSADDDQAVADAARLCEAAQSPVVLNGAPVDIALTAGLARTGLVNRTVASPVDRAAIAVDQARAVHIRAMGFDAGRYGDPAGNLSLISELMAASTTASSPSTTSRNTTSAPKASAPSRPLPAGPTRAAAASRRISSSAWPRRRATSAR